MNEYRRSCIVAAIRSPSGASAGLLEAALAGKVTILVNVALILEYEAVCSRTKPLSAAALDARQLGIFLDGLAALAEPIESHFIWRPQRRDASDEMVLEAAVNGEANGIVRFNTRDFVAGTERFGLRLMLPREAGIRMNQFVATAVAEKLAVMNTASVFTERRDRADIKAFKRILKRKGGEAPRPGDER